MAIAVPWALPISVFFYLNRTDSSPLSMISSFGSWSSYSISFLIASASSWESFLPPVKADTSLLMELSKEVLTSFSVH